jgi:thiazole synthase
MATSVLEPTIDLGGHGAANGLWHCFGHQSPAVDRDTIRAMLDASGTQLLPINTHTGRPIIGHGNVTWTAFQEEADWRGITPCLNINLQTTASGAVAQAVRFADQTGIRLLKLEVLKANLRESNNEACMDATEMLAKDGYTVMPLLDPLPGLVRMLSLEPNVPVVRVMGSPIGSGQGIESPDMVAECCRQSVKPVILDGGIGTVDHARQALELGCAGFLVNSCLFAPTGPGPAAVLAQYREAFA